MYRALGKVDEKIDSACRKNYFLPVENEFSNPEFFLQLRKMNSIPQKHFTTERK